MAAKRANALQTRIQNQRSRLLEHLRKYGIVSQACEQVGISRETYYEWRSKNEKFANEAEAAIALGKSSVNDLARTGLIRNIKDGNLGAIKYQLSNCDPDFMPKPRPIPPEQVYHPVELVEIHDAPTREQLEKQRAEVRGETSPPTSS